jgi:hypothetical protein
MKKAFAVIFFLGFATTSGFAQNDTPVVDPTPTTTIFIARTGVRTDSPHVGTYHDTELFQLRGNWIYPDVGYVDFANNNYREIYVGAGRTLFHSDRATIATELYFDQATGPDAHSARYFQVWTLVDFNLTSKVSTETVYFPYIPLNQSARVQHVIERAKIEYHLGKNWKVGGGYAAYQYGEGDWQNKPMLTVTRSTKSLGSLETWLQKMPGGAQVQLRYTFVHTAHR